MTLEELLKLASRHYPDAEIEHLWDEEKLVIRPSDGDILAWWIAWTLESAIDRPDKGREEILADAVQALSDGIDEIAAVIFGLKSAMEDGGITASQFVRMLMKAQEEPGHAT